ncbi:Peptide methionine sulfoxide reductase A2-1 [Coemansia guatemalensis]|uniref:peptide-methionine (S)-S-oxide reductase n=1 Tax=Coemansia guatemalensis TaxID=2761395 RepID=A0A9W8HZJ5_9FUNG|nr:Peptide methionine sulfoxide reductase A2-1 [Coemansia guatemalensis]
MSSNRDQTIPPLVQATKGSTELATFAAGCFWSVELVYQRKEGVLQTQVGYTGGREGKTSYKEVCSGTTGHAEAVRMEYDPTTISYNDLLSIFWTKHNPTQGNRQGNDVGSQYRSAIFYHTAEQMQLAQASKAEEQEKYDKPITTEITPAGTFYAAEAYHQRYLEKGGQCASKGCNDSILCYGY